MNALFSSHWVCLYLCGSAKIQNFMWFALQDHRRIIIIKTNNAINDHNLFLRAFVTSYAYCMHGNISSPSQKKVINCGLIFEKNHQYCNVSSWVQNITVVCPFDLFLGGKTSEHMCQRQFAVPANIWTRCSSMFEQGLCKACLCKVHRKVPKKFSKSLAPIFALLTKSLV